MGDSLHLLANGFAVILNPHSLACCALGAFWGTVVGVLPGLGPLAGMTLLLPLTFALQPVDAVVMLAGIFNGAMYGGSTTSILMRVPGEAASIITCIDGYEMAKQGKAGRALFIAAFGSFIGGTVSVMGLMLIAPPLAEAMLQVGPPVEFTLMTVALVILALASTGPALRTIAMIALGLLIGAVGLDPLTAWPRFTFGSMELADGVDFLSIAIGLFGVSEIFANLDSATPLRPFAPRFRDLLPRLADIRESAPAIGRGTLIGFLFGIVPGVSHILSTFTSYAIEKRFARHPEEFGHGAIAGVAGPETANNATTGSAMIPLLVLGIPSIPATALLLSALMVHGVQAGPLLMVEHPDVFWGLIASMYVGNVILLILNVPLVSLFVSLLRIPYGYLAPTVLLICMIGVYSTNGSGLDLWLMIGFGVLGYILKRFDFDPTPLLIAVVLGERIEVSFRRSLTISDGDFSIFVTGTSGSVLIGAAACFATLFLLARAYGYRRSLVSD